LEASHVTEVAALREKSVAATELGPSSSSRSVAEHEAAQQRLAYMMDERDNLRNGIRNHACPVRDAEMYLEKKRELSREVDRLTVPAASVGGAAGNVEFEKRLDRVERRK
jgi:hypothetical protein